MDDKYWFSLHSSVFVWKKTNVVLFYDSNKYLTKRYELTDSLICEFVDKLLDINNLYCIEVCEQDLENDVFKFFVYDLVNCGFGDIQLQNSQMDEKPIQLPPILNIQTEVSRLKKEGVTDLTIGENVLMNLYEIKIILPEENNTNYFSSLAVLLKSLEKSEISTVVIMNYNIKNELKDNFLNHLKRLPSSKEFVFEADDISETLLEEFDKIELMDFRLKIVFPHEYLLDKLHELGKLLRMYSFDLELEFQIHSEEYYLILDEYVIANLSCFKTNFKPVFIGDNILFFEKYVYISEDDFQTMELSKKNVFAQQAINTNDFGKLTITSNGEVYANINHPPLGTICNDIRELVYREMTNGISWFRIRDKQPCCDCVYQWLCPSPSDYELQMNKFNLCSVVL